MKILRAIRSVNPEGGGPIEGVKQSSKILEKLGHRVELISLDDPNLNYVKEFPFKLYAIGPVRSLYGYSTAYVPWLKSNKNKYDAVIVQGIWQYHSFGVWRALKKTDIPYYVFTHGMLDPWFKQNYPLKHLKKWIYWPWAEYNVLKYAKKVLFTSEEEKLRARKSFWLYKCNECVVNYGTAGTPKNKEYMIREFYNKFQSLEKKRIILYLGRLHEKKGIDNLIMAFKKYEKYDEKLHLVIAGPDSNGYKHILQKKVIKLKLNKKVTWTGMISNNLKWGALHSSEILVLPSHQENFGVVVAEALSCGLPVLVSDKVNIWREIINDKAGIVSKDTLSGTEKLLELWLNCNKKDKENMKKNAKTSFKNRFDMAKSTHELLNLIENDKKK